VTLAQEVEKLDPLAQPALHHLRAADHFADDRRNFPGAEIKAAIELRFERFDGLDKIAIARICGNLSEPKTMRRGIDQFAVFDQSRRLGEPGRIPERTDFAPRLIALSGSAIETFK
jgi:hypothetical protein